MPRNEMGKKIFKRSKKDEEAIRTKYFCQIINGQVQLLGDPTVLTVMEIDVPEVDSRPDVSFRYVLVIDVSSSMELEMGDKPGSLLDRVKVFIELVIQAVSRKDSIAIVTFSDDAVIEFPMTRMNETSKENARAVVKYITTKQNTNLESGLMTAVNVLASNPNEDSLDCIVLFTDGETNTGLEDAEKLIENFKVAHQKLAKRHSVPLSALTIGQYMPVLLTQLSDTLGSDAFYWLSEEEDFETDMLLPVFLRETTRVTDVSIELTCLSNFTFDVDSLLMKHLKKSSLTTVEYFLHSIPGGITKHMPLTIIPPEGDLEAFHGQPIIEVKISYIQLPNAKVEKNESILFSNENLKTCRTKVSKEKGVLYSKVSAGISAYMVENGRLDLSWTAAQDALLRVVREDCRMLTLRELDNALYLILEEGNKLHVDSFDEAIDGIEDIKRTYRGIFGHRNKCTAMIDKCADEWISLLQFGRSIANPYNYGRITALHSSIAAEMPVPTGVHKESHHLHFMPKEVRKKLKKFENIMKKKTTRLGGDSRSSVFGRKTILLSESLRTKVYGNKKETMADLIARHGGRPEYYVIVSPYKSHPEWYVNRSFRNTLLVSSWNDHKTNSLIVRAAKKAHVPIVREDFVLDCLRRKKYLKIEGYFYNSVMT